MSERYRYRLLSGVRKDSAGEPWPYTLLLRDDRYRISYMVVAPEENSAVGEWHNWAEYKQSELVGPAAMIADSLMREDT